MDPSDTAFPAAYLRVLRLGLLNFEPWRIMSVGDSTAKREELASRYLDRFLLPFAVRQDNDDIACWIDKSCSSVAVVHDFASEGFELVQEFPDFSAWLRTAFEDFLDWE